MNFELITSKSNDRIKRVAALIKSSSNRKEQGLFVLEGLRLCRDAAINSVKCAELYLTESAVKKFGDDVDLLASFAERSFVVSPDVFSKISDTDNSQGVVAVYKFDAVNMSNNITKSGRYIACENLSDPSNLGAISRTAEALGLSGMILLGHCCDRFNPKALRASMGALLRLDVHSFADVSDAVDLLHENGMRVISSVVRDNAMPINEVKFADGDVVVIGNEANGISDLLIDKSDLSLTIPIKGRSESFNAAAAAAIIMWELSSR